jgi:hypothetical protein
MHRLSVAGFVWHFVRRLSLSFYCVMRFSVVTVFIIIIIIIIIINTIIIIIVEFLTSQL